MHYSEASWFIVHLVGFNCTDISQFTVNKTFSLLMSTVKLLPKYSACVAWLFSL
jgi:hypothetical protein